MKPQDQTTKPVHDPVARAWVRCMRVSLGILLLAAVMTITAIWMPYPYSGNLMVTALVIAVLSVPGFIIATSLWSRVPREDEAWCTTLGLAEVGESRPEPRSY